jgi:hypothetical protein
MAALTFFNPWEPAPAFAPAPPDRELADRVHLLVKFIVPNGPSFIQMMKGKHAGDPKFTFLTEGGEGYGYFRWFLYCSAYNLPPDQPLAGGAFPPHAAPQHSATPPPGHYPHAAAAQPPPHHAQYAAPPPYGAPMGAPPPAYGAPPPMLAGYPAPTAPPPDAARLAAPAPLPADVQAGLDQLLEGLNASKVTLH